MPTRGTRAPRGIQLQLLIPPRPEGTAEPRGVVYTKRWVVDLLLNLAGYTAEKNLVDAVAIEPAAGSGAFLEAIVERLIASCQRQGRPATDCQRSLVAYEVDESSAAAARNVVVSVLTKFGVPASMAGELAGAWVHAGDYLFEAASMQADYIIGNPPYVRLEDIPDCVAAAYRKMYPAMTGRADLYVAFFVAALHQLRVGGICAFICADRWMRNQYGTQLREMIASAYSLDVVIEMHRADAFHEDVDAYPAITVIRRGKQDTVVVASAENGTGELDARVLSEQLRAVTNSAPAPLLRGVTAARVDKWFEGADPWPYASPERLALLRRLEKQFPVLEYSAKVGIGVATGNDGVFITRDAELVERRRLLKLALAQDLHNGILEWSGHYLIDPWDQQGLVDLDLYPRLRTYLKEHAVALKRRHTAKKNPHTWFKTIDRVNHSVTRKSKLYIADIKNSLNPVLDSGQTYPHHNLYFILSDKWDIEVLGGLLLSPIGQFFIESYGVRMRGGYFRFQAQYLRRIRVPDPRFLTTAQSMGLRTAFHARDRETATKLAVEIYGITDRELEILLGH